MKKTSVRRSVILGLCLVVAAMSAVLAEAQHAPSARQFPPGSVNRVEDLPPGRFRTHLQSLPDAARRNALERLRSFHFTELDLQTLEVDQDGGVFYVDPFEVAPADAAATDPVTAAASVPVSPFPAGLLFHSRPGAPNVLFLNFSGSVVSNTAWNTSLGRSSVPALAFSTDTDYTTFSDSEQTAIKRIWQRVAEDYSPFDVDVTTERPATMGTRVAEALITRNTDANGAANPSSTAGGIAYVNMFATSSFATYRPAWIYINNLANNSSYIAEAAAHELGHNVGLSHDGTSSTSYYGGHGTGDTSWGPIMGTGYDRNVSQWSKGEYYDANNTQDDLSIIAGKLTYRADDHGNTAAAATALVITGGTNLVSTTPETDPSNTSPANKGVLEKNTDVDVFSFTCGSGTVKLNVNPWITPSGTRGGNLDVSLELQDANGTVLATNNPSLSTTGQILVAVASGTYYLFVRNSGVGTPLSSTPTGYTSYGSIGQYFISGSIPLAAAAQPTFQLTASPNNGTWGSVSPSNATYAAGTSVQLSATAKPYYQFASWSNGVSGTANPVTVTLQSNTSVTAVFKELLTTNNPTPYWWLASYGYTNNFEAAAAAIGSNGMPRWQSYVAGLNPNSATNQLRIAVKRSSNGLTNVLSWATVTGRVYTVWWSTNITNKFVALSGASNLAANVQSVTNVSTTVRPTTYYRLEVKKL